MTTILDPNTILDKQQFLALPKEQRKELMQYWRQNYSTKKIRKVMGYQNSTGFYNMLKSLGLPTNLSKLPNEQVEEPQKNLKNGTGIYVHVVLSGNIDVNYLPQLYAMAQQNQLDLKINN